ARSVGATRAKLADPSSNGLGPTIALLAMGHSMRTPRTLMRCRLPPSCAGLSRRPSRALNNQEFTRSVSRVPWLSRGLGLPSPHHNEERALGGNRAQPGKLRHHAHRLRGWIGGCKHSAAQAIGAEDRRFTIQVGQVVLLEPLHHLVDRMPGLVRIVILILDPDIGLAGITYAIANDIVDLRPEYLDQPGAHRCRHARKPIVKPDDDDASRLGLPNDRRK